MQKSSSLTTCEIVTRTRSFQNGSNGNKTERRQTDKNKWHKLKEKNNSDNKSSRLMKLQNHHQSWQVPMLEAVETMRQRETSRNKHSTVVSVNAKTRNLMTFKSATAKKEGVPMWEAMTTMRQGETSGNQWRKPANTHKTAVSGNVRATICATGEGRFQN